MPALSLGLGLPFGDGGGGAPEATDFFARIISAGGTITPTQQAAVITFIAAAQEHGYWTKIKRLNLFLGQQLAGALVPLVNTAGFTTDTNGGPFLEANYSTTGGLTGNGSTRYLDTGLAPGTSLTLNSTHIGIWNRSSSVSSGTAMGAGNEAPNCLSMYAPFTDSIVYMQQYGATAGGGQIVVAAGATPYGFILGSRQSDSQHNVFKNGTSIAQQLTQIFTTLPTSKMFIFARASNTNTAGGFVNFRLLGYTIGDGLTAAQALAYHTDVAALNTTLGRS